jgi:UDP-glucose 4-epimerase
MGPRRDGDVIAIYADNHKAAEMLNWTCQYDMDEMMLTAYNWGQNL